MSAILDVGRRISVVAIALLCVIGCDKSDGTAGSGSQAAPPRVLPVFGTATVRGSVKFIGTPPVRETIPNQPCHASAGPLKDETVVVNDDGTLANVFVYLVGAPASDGANREPAVLDQKDCRYVPHVVAVQVGQALRVKSSDATLHNVHYNPSANPPGNFGMTSAGSEKSVTFQQPEFIRVKCDVHPWMTAYVGVFDHPFFAVTSEGDGKFEISKVPAGDYKLVAWHDRYGSIERRLSLKENESADLSLEFKSP